MKLFYSPFHTFVHKALVVAYDAGLWDAMTFVPTYPFKNRNGEDQGDRYSIAALNPLNKVPTLALDTGQVIYGSQAVVEYLDANRRSGPRLYPPEGPARWDAITRLALADTMFESTVVLVMEGWHPEPEQRLGTFEWIWPKLIGGLDALERACQRGFEAFDIGHVGMLQMVSYLDFRTRFYKAKDPLHPGYDWAQGRPALKAWFDAAIQRPAVQSHYCKDFPGDDSAQYLRRNVEEVLAARQRNGM
jgi:glutathione S-transferase